ncbi:MAG: adenosylcobinamide-GDP ribazoletransferase [Planctomycetota bacterium]|nr:adenosylcobinamide-GDP ribazoletransferase [Planctomycetota bacterium]
MKQLLAALRFLTILPMPGTWGTTETDLAGSVPWFPVVGLLLGALAATVAWDASLVLPPLVAAVVILGVLMTVSGCLHLDGLADTADGCLSSRSRERMLEIMKDSRTGAMGVVAVVVLLLTKFAALASLPAEVLWRAVLLMPLAGRCAMVVHVAVLPCVRPSGLGALFYQRRSRLAAIWAVGVLAAVAWGLLGRRGLVVCGAGLAVTLALAVYVHRKLGGTTGDTLGAVCEIVEVVPALLLLSGPAEI